MDAFAQLALMAKAKRVFESSDTFLSFPALSPLSYLPDQLRFGGAEMTSQDLLEASEFARYVNLIPRSAIAPMDDGDYLWDIYRDVLQTATVASGVMSVAEKDTYDTAMAVLYTAGEGGFRTDSDKVRTYKQARDLKIKAEEEYKNQQSTAEASTDVAVLDQWKNVDEPRLRQQVQEREQAWASSGFKAEIEAAQQVEQAGAARAASIIWADWRGQFNDDLDLLTDPSAFRFAITGYSPMDILDADNWPRFTLSGEEITQLAEQAPPELREIFAAGTQATPIESISFEYRSAAAIRPWFRKEVLKARFWRFPDGIEQLSDGSATPTGRLPAYVTALVFARNVEIKLKESVAGATESAPPLQVLLQLDAATVNPALRELVRSARPVRMATTVPIDAEVARPLTIDSSRATLRLKSMSFAGARIAPLRASSIGVADVAVPMHARLVDRPMLVHAVASAGAIAPSAAAPEPAPAPEPEPAPPPTRAGEVIVLAFICKRVPRSPDPDLSLPWN